MAGLDKWLYNFARRMRVPYLVFTGNAMTVPVVHQQLMKNNNNDTLACTGALVPTIGSAGFAKGCLFFKTDPATGLGSVYINVGTNLLCSFQLMNYPPWLPQSLTALPKTGDYTVTVANMLVNNFTNAGAGGTVVFTLPDVILAAGLPARFWVLAAQIVRLLPASTQVIAYAGNVVADKYIDIGAVIGSFVEVYSDGVYWHVTNANGVCTKQA
jgi:hypothetical protein